MKALQVLLFLLGGFLAIYAGVDNGYTVAITGIIFAFFGTVVVPEAYQSLTAKKTRGGGRQSGSNSLSDDSL